MSSWGSKHIGLTISNGDHMCVEMSATGANEHKGSHELRDKCVSERMLAVSLLSMLPWSRPLVRLYDRNTKACNPANKMCSDNATNGDGHAGTVYGRRHLTRNNASDGTQAHLHNDIERSSNLRRPITH